MRRLALIAVAFALVALPARADDDAEKDWKDVQTFLETGAAKKPDEKRAFQAEAEKRLREFLDKHKDAAPWANPARYVLARMMTDQKKPDAALPLYEELAKSDDQDMKTKGRFGVVRSLIDKRDLKAARARLDAFQKDQPDDTLKPLDEHLKKLEKSDKRAAALKRGVAAPPIAGKTLKGDELAADRFAGKILLVDFDRSDAPPWKPSVARLKRLLEKWREKGLEVVTIALESDEKKLGAAVDDAKLAWPVVLGDDAKRIALEWGVKSIPFVAIVAKDGKIAVVGLRADKGDEVDVEVEAAITGKRKKDDDGMGLGGE